MRPGYTPSPELDSGTTERAQARVYFARALAAAILAIPVMACASTWTGTDQGVVIESGSVGVGIPVEAEHSVEEVLASLPALPKPHFSWPLPGFCFSEAGIPRLEEIARITHAVSFSGESATESIVRAAVRACAAVMSTGHAESVSLGINFSPWHRKYPRGVPIDPSRAEYRAEIVHFESNAKKILAWVGEANRALGSDVRIGAVILDSERFAKSLDLSQNAEMTNALDLIHDAAKEIFGNVMIVWYGRGTIYRPLSDAYGKVAYWTGTERTDVLSCSLYSVPYEDRMRGTLRSTIDLAASMGIRKVVPFLALGSGYRNKDAERDWAMDWEYDMERSRAMGNLLNEEAPDAMAQSVGAVVFYPPPFDGRVPDWFEHFAAYVRGAAPSP